MVYGYARVSSKGQQREGNSLEDQREQLVAMGAQEIIEECYTGTTMARPKFNALLEKLQPGDTLLVTKFDRIARTAAEGELLIRRLKERGIVVNIANMGISNDTTTGKLLLTILAAFAEFERNSIIDRTQAGKEIARQKPGYREGRPLKYTKAQLDHAMELLKTHSYTQVASMTGISKSTLLRAKRRTSAKE